MIESRIVDAALYIYSDTYSNLTSHPEETHLKKAEGWKSTKYPCKTSTNFNSIPCLQESQA
jgi:hypothetical protein